MKKSIILSSIFAFLAMGTMIGCDNRSQLEKDADKAGQQLNKSADEATKKLGL
ncbi:MAG: hypothetical protein KBD53_07250 [Candidatus Omnitrophica bacterium]|nr:hypothetical protein [Candidatus Omnitrophota bacterium]